MLETLFPNGKPLIAMLQAAPLPGAYRHRGQPFQAVLDEILREAELLAEAGFDGVQLQNMGDAPSARQAGTETVAYMTALAVAVRALVPHLSLSILVNWDAQASIAVAEAAGADFVRVEHTWTGVAVASWGLSEASCHEATRFHARIGATVPIFADVLEPHAVPLAPLPPAEAAVAAVVEGGAHGLYVTGRSFEESVGLLRAMRPAVPEVPLMLGGGATPDTLDEALEVADGVTVATWIKGGDMRRSTDPGRAREFVAAGRDALLRIRSGA